MIITTYISIIFISARVGYGISMFNDHKINRKFISSTQLHSERIYDDNYNESEIYHRINTWNSDDKQNVWELSGLFEGDIMLNHEKQFIKNGLIDTATRWPNGTIPYLIQNEEFDDEGIAKIHEAIKEFHNNTCLIFRDYDEQIDSDYVIFQSKNSGCWSSVGKQGESQFINLQTPCLKHGTIVHEILHAVGFYHQQSAFNRDEYIKIHWENIQDGKEHNFNKYDKKTITDFDVGYDYNSLMHYSSGAFSKNDKPTITPIKEGARIGQRKKMSGKDMKKLQAMYKDECSRRKVKKSQSADIDDLIESFPSLPE